MWFIHSIAIPFSFFPARQWVGIRYAAVPRTDMPRPVNDIGRDTARARRHTHSVHGGGTTDSQLGLISSPSDLEETLLLCSFSVNTNTPPAYSTNYVRNRLGYFSLTFTNDLVMAYIIHVWEYPRLIGLKLLLYISSVKDLPFWDYLL